MISAAARAWAPLCLAVLFAACRDGGSNTHVYRAPRPVPPPRPVIVTPPAPELPIGTLGAEARITDVKDGATGAPIAMTRIVAPFVVITLVGRGPVWSPDHGARIELLIDGPTDTTLVLPLTPPAPVIVSHAFVVPVKRAGGTGLASGDYSAYVRIVMRDTATLAMSAPIYFIVER